MFNYNGVANINIEIYYDSRVMTYVRTNVLVNVSFQPVKSILLITTNYFSSTKSRNLERANDDLQLM